MEVLTFDRRGSLRFAPEQCRVHEQQKHHAADVEIQVEALQRWKRGEGIGNDVFNDVLPLLVVDGSMDGGIIELTSR